MSTSDKSIYTQSTKPQAIYQKRVDCLIDQHIYVRSFSEEGIVYVFLSEETITIFIVCSDVMKLLQIIQTLADIEKVESSYYLHFVLKVS